MFTDAIAIVGVGIALLAVLVPLLLVQGRRIGALAADVAATRTELRADVAEVRRELREDLVEVRRELRDDLAEVRREVRNDLAELRREVRTDLAEVRTELHVLSDRVARIEGALTGPWRPNGPPAAPPGTLPETTA